MAVNVTWHTDTNNGIVTGQRMLCAAAMEVKQDEKYKRLDNEKTTVAQNRIIWKVLCVRNAE